MALTRHSDHPSSTRQSAPAHQRVARFCVAGAALCGLLGLLGNLPGRGVLASFGDRFNRMSPLTAVSLLLLSGIVLFLQPQRHAHRAARVASSALVLAVLLMGAARWVQLWAAPSIGVDAPAGWMALLSAVSPLTALALIMAGVAVLRLPSDAAGWLSVCIAALGLTVLVGYLYGTPLLYNTAAVPVALPTGIGLLFLGIALVAANGPDCRPLRALAGDTTSARLLRAFLPITVVGVLAYSVVYRLLVDYMETLPDLLNAGPAAMPAVSAVVFAAGAAIVIARVARSLSRALDEAETARAGATEQLARSEARLRGIVEGQTEFIVRTLPDGTLTFVNEAMCRYAGLPREQLIGRNGWAFIHPDDRPRFDAHMAALRADSPAETIEVRAITPTGELRWQHWIDVPISDESGRVVEFQSVGRDITHQKQAEAELQASRERYRMLVENLNEVVYTMDLSGVFTYMSPVIERLSQYRAADFVGRSCLDFVHLGDRDGLKQALDNVLNGEMKPSEFRVLDKDGAVRYFHNSSRLLRENGQPTGVFGLLTDITERRAAEHALRLSDSRYRAVVEAQTDLILRVRPDGTRTFVNEAMCRYWGETREQLLGRDSWQYIHPDDRDAHRHHIAALTPDHPSAVNERRAIHRSGEVRWQQWIDRGIFAADGTLAEIQSVGRDITEQKQAQEALRESTARLRAIFDSAPIGIALVDLEGHPMECNPASLALLGYTAAELQQMRFTEYTHPEDAALDWAQYQHLIAGQIDEYEMDKRYIRKDGRVIWARLTCTLLRDAEGRPRFSLGMTEDITERRLVEEAIRESRARLQAMFDRAAIGVVLTDPQGLVMQSNPAVQQMLGYSAEEFARMTFDQFTHPDDVDESLRCYGRLMGGEIDRFQLDKRYLPKSGGVIYGRVTVSSVRDAAGQPQFAIAMIEDVTEHKRLEDQFRQAQKMETVGRLAGGVAHDFNNLLTAISGYGSLARRSLPVDHSARADIDQVLKAAERAATLTKRLLAFSRRQIIALQVTNLNELILDMDKMLRRLIHEDIELRTVPDPDLGQVKVDPGQIEQVVVNLVVNARDAMPGGGKLTIETANTTVDEPFVEQHIGATPGEYVLLTVSDTGTGMTDEVKAHLFEPFFTTKEVGKGTGLGLATVYGIVKQHGGNVYVHSEPGQGTIVKLYLPRADQPAEPARKAEEVAPQIGGGETILVAEDEPLVRALAVRVLTDLGYQVLEAADGPTALKLAESHPGAIDLLVTDVIMPQMNGKVLHERLAVVRPGLKALFVSGYADHAIVHHGMLDGGLAFLQKPFTSARLAQKVRELLDSQG
jgi:two-component system, cell cycle sensor histidine kinase and response regulator CckA